MDQVQKQPLRKARPQPRTTQPKVPALTAQTPAASVAKEIVAPSTTAQASALEFENIASTRMFETLGSLRAITPRAEEGPAYSKEEILAVAEVAYHYLRCGGFKLAYVLFEALAVIDPGDSYFALALGLSAEKLGDHGKAIQHYQRARQLDPLDARADANLAEVFLETGDRPRAVQLLASAVRKAASRGEPALENKAAAMLKLLSPRS